MRVLVLLFVALALGAHYKNIWKKIGPAAGTHRVTIGLKQQNVDQLEEKLLDISDPDSPNYSNWMSKEEILGLVAPPKKEAMKVVYYLEGKCAFTSGLAKQGCDIKFHGDSVEISAPVPILEQALGIKLARFVHEPTGFAITRRDATGPEPHLGEVDHLVDIISCLEQFPYVRKSHDKPKEIHSNEATYRFIVPASLRVQYNIPAMQKVTNMKASQSVIEYLPVGKPTNTDIKAFATQTKEPYTPFYQVIGPVQDGFTGESTLDSEYITHVALGANTSYITLGDGWAFETAQLLFNMNEPPLVNSVSYGWMEKKTCQTEVTHAKCESTTAAYIKRSNTEFAKLGAHGISMIICDQDEGAPSDENRFCQLDNSAPVWSIYPAASPWVTAVSATTITVGPSSKPALSPAPPICFGRKCSGGGGVEWPCEVNNTFYKWTTGGGFSSYAPMPAYQKEAVAKWMSSGAMKPPSQFFTATNRAYPDVAAAGDRFLIIQGQQPAVTAGTSAATPVFAGVVTLLNDWRMNNGKKPLGFLNTMLYKMGKNHPKAFHDVTEGDNHCSIGQCCKYGYGASKGWDPVSGWGTPNYQEMLNYIKTLP